MSYLVVKTIRGRRYLYEQRTWREGGRVRTQSRSLGPLDPPLRRSKGPIRRIADLIAANRATEEERVAAVAAREAERIEKYQRDVFGETAEDRSAREHRDLLENLHRQYGLRVGSARPAAGSDAADRRVEADLPPKLPLGQRGVATETGSTVSGGDSDEVPPAERLGGGQATPTE